MLFLLAAAVAWTTLSGCQFSTASPETPPNVILIMTDDQGYGDIGAHGNSILKTPYLDRLYNESVRLTDFHVDPTCSPTRAALMTGRYSTKTGVWHTVAGRSQLRREETTIADIFSEAGYATGIFGKWHLGDNYPFRPQDRGFQETVIHGGGGIGQTPDAWGNDYFDDIYWKNGQTQRFEGYCTTVFFDQALEFIKKHREEPFFAYIPTNVAHSPRNVPEEYTQPYLEKGVPERLARFYGMLTHFDGQLGRLREKLRAWGVAENTILVFMTDNGTAGRGFNAKMRGRKGSEYEGGHRVPFYIYWPGGGLSGGKDLEQLTAHIDLLPTLLKLTGIQQPKNLDFDGKNLVPLLQESSRWPERTLFVHSQRIQHPKKWRKSAVMTERWRLVNGKELYDVEADPGQKDDVAHRHPQVVEQLRSSYNQWWKELAPRFDEYTRIVLGAPEDPESRLTAHDWQNPTPEVPWNQPQVQKDPKLNGFWTVEVARSGRYEVVLRQRPKNVSYPLNGSNARIKIGDQTKTKSIPAATEEVAFQIDLKEGPARLQTWLNSGGSRDSKGAYYTYVRYLGKR